MKAINERLLVYFWNCEIPYLSRINERGNMLMYGILRANKIKLNSVT